MNSAIVPFTLAHVKYLEEPQDEPGFLGVLGANKAYFKAIADSGNAYSLFVDSEFLGCAGHFLMPWGSACSVWVWALPAARKYPFIVHRAVKRMLERIESDPRIVRVSCEVKTDNERAKRWIELLGFACETPDGMRRYGPCDETYLLYGKVKN